MKLLYPALRLIASVLILYAGYSAFQKMDPPESHKRPPSPVKHPVVQVSIVDSHDGVISFEVDGVVVPYRQIEIAPQISGRVVEKSDDCRTGYHVQAGDVLFQIDPTDFELEVRRMKAEVRTSEAQIGELASEKETIEKQIESAGKQLLIDRRTLQRTKEMRRRKAASASETDAAKRSELTSHNDVQMLMDQLTLLHRRQVRLESALALSKANLDKAKLSLQRTEIRSPIDAIIAADTVEKDSYVQTGQSVLTLQDTSQLNVTCKLRANQMNWLWLSQAKKKLSMDSEAITKNHASTQDAFPITPARIQYDLGGVTYQWKGLVDRYDGAGMDAQTRMVPCRIHVDAPRLSKTVQPGSSGKRILSEWKEEPIDSVPSTLGPNLMTGMFVKAIIDVAPIAAMVRIPQSAIQPGNTVWTVCGGVLTRRPIRIVTGDQDIAIVAPSNDSIMAGDAIVVSPMPNPVEGSKVLIEGSPEHIAQVEADKKRAATKRSWGGGNQGKSGDRWAKQKNQDDSKKSDKKDGSDWKKKGRADRQSKRSSTSDSNPPTSRKVVGGTAR